MKERYKPDLKTTVIIPGWNEDLDRPWIEPMVDELKKRDSMNIVIVDWAKGAKVLSYVQGLANGRVVGVMIGYFIKQLITNFGADPSTFHLIGNSLGGHVAGTTGAWVKNIQRITGLDPPSRRYDGHHPDARLDPTDARIVDVIHTDGDPWFLFGFGSMAPMGTLDFYANRGVDQPGCSHTIPDILIDMIFRNLGFQKCSHSMAHTLFISSINGICPFVAGYCDSLEDMEQWDCAKCRKGLPCAVWGYDLLAYQNGIYAFDTQKDYPYCNGTVIDVHTQNKIVIKP